MILAGVKLTTICSLNELVGRSGVKVTKHAPKCSSSPKPLDHVTIFSMPTDQILTLLVSERDKLTRAIEALQGPTKRRGRPPKNVLAVPTPAAAPAPAKRKKRHFSEAQRKHQGERMKAYWAAKKSAEATAEPKTKRKAKKKAEAA